MISGTAQTPNRSFQSTVPIVGLVGALSAFIFICLNVLLTFISLSQSEYWLLVIGAALTAFGWFWSRRPSTGSSVAFLSHRGWRSMASGAALMFVIAGAYCLFDAASTIGRPAPALANTNRGPGAQVDAILGRNDAAGELEVVGKSIVVTFTVPESWNTTNVRFMFNQDVIKLVPPMLAKYPEATNVEVIGRHKQAHR